MHAVVQAVVKNEAPEGEGQGRMGRMRARAGRRARMGMGSRSACNACAHAFACARAPATLAFKWLLIIKSYWRATLLACLPRGSGVLRRARGYCVKFMFS